MTGAGAGAGVAVTLPQARRVVTVVVRWASRTLARPWPDCAAALSIIIVAAVMAAIATAIVLNILMLPWFEDNLLIIYRKYGFVKP